MFRLRRLNPLSTYFNPNHKLDQMAVRVSDIPNLHPSQINAPTMNLQAAGAPYAALGELAQGVASIGGPLSKWANRIQDVENAKTESRIQNQWHTALSDLQTKLQNEPSAEVRRQKTADLVSSLLGTIDSVGVAPVVRDRLALKFDEWATGANIGAARDALKLEEQQSRDQFVAGWSESLRTLDRERAAREIETRRQYGLISDGEEAQLWQQFDREEQKGRIANLINDDPLGAVEALKKPSFVQDTFGISEADRLKFLKAAETEVSGLQRDSLKKISEQMDRGDISTEAELAEAMKLSPFLEGYEDELAFALSQKTPVDQETRFGLTDAMNDLHDAFKSGEMTREDYRVAHDELARAVYALGSRDGAGALRQRVHALDPAAWSDGRQLQETNRKASLQRSVEAISKLYQQQNAFGQVDEDAEPAVRAEQAVAALQTRGRIEQSLARWVEQHPEATEEEISSRYKKVYLDEIAGDVLTPPAPTIERRRQLLEDLRGGGGSTSGGPKGARDDTPDTPVGGSLREMVKSFEGYHEKAYHDVRQYSVGWGTKGKQGEVITKQEAERRLDSELSMHRKRVVREAERIGMKFSPPEIDALTSFDFNTGSVAKLLANGTRSKAEIASAMLLYRNAGGKRLRGLERRRIAEAALFRRGWGGQKHAVATPPSSTGDQNDGDFAEYNVVPE